MRDSKGNLLPVVGMTFEEFEELLRLKKGLTPAPPPNFTLDALSIAGTVNGAVVDLQITATARVRAQGWARIPLGLPEVVLRQSPRLEGTGEHFLDYEEPTGYILWLKSDDQTPHVVTIQASAGLDAVGEERRLALALPRATESSLRVTTPGAALEATLDGGEGIVATSAKGMDRSEIAVLGASGELVLTWRPTQRTPTAGPALFDASGEIAVKIESESRISSDAKLRVRSLNKPLDVFQVRLPPGMELVPTSPTGYSVAIVSPPAAAAGGRGAQSQVVEVRLEKPTAGTTEIRLLATSLPGTSASTNLTPARFEVVGAVRQRGTIDFTVEGEWQVDWQEDATVRRLDIAADAAAARLAARYEYFRQPCGLTLKVAARPSRVTVEPTYFVYVEPRQIRVETTLKYRLRGSRAAGLDFQLGNLQFDRLSPDDALDAPQQQGTDGLLHVPFRQAAVLPAELDLKLETHHTLPPQASEFSLTLPRPLADSVAPATVFVLAADNVELSPKSGELAGLSADTAAAPASMAPRQQPALVYRDLGGSEAAVFAASLRIRTRATIAEAHADVRIDRRQLQLEQRLKYSVLHEPQRTFVLTVPRSLSLVNSVQVWLGNEPLSLSPAATSPTDSATAERLQFSLPTEQIGTFSVVVRYAHPLPRWDGERPIAVTIPLVLPADDDSHQFAGQQIEFNLADDLQIEPELAGVDEFSRPTAIPGAAPGTAYTWSKASGTTRWIVQPARGGQATPVVCHKAWIQTWLSPQTREDRAAFRFTTSTASVRLKLPEGTAPTSVQAALNAEPIAVLPREASRYQIELPAANRGRECVLEVWYSLPAPPRRAGLLAAALQPPTLESATPPRRSYWQLALPENEHLILPPGDLASEMAWNSNSWLVGRQPLLDQRQLEAWIASSRQDLLPRGLNEHLYGSLGRAPALRLVVANRRALLALASGLILVLGLLALHWPPLRSPTALLVAAAVVIGLSLAAPDAALLVGRAALLGLVVAVAFAALRWALSGSAHAAWVKPASASARPDSVASTALPGRSERAPPITTATAPTPIAVGGPH